MGFQGRQALGASLRAEWLGWAWAHSLAKLNAAPEVFKKLVFYYNVPTYKGVSLEEPLVGSCSHTDCLCWCLSCYPVLCKGNITMTVDLFQPWCMFTLAMVR
jgi:hypothetical protein